MLDYPLFLYHCLFLSLPLASARSLNRSRVHARAHTLFLSHAIFLARVRARCLSLSFSLSLSLARFFLSLSRMRACSLSLSLALSLSLSLSLKKKGPWDYAVTVQECLAHKKEPPPTNLQ